MHITLDYTLKKKITINTSIDNFAINAIVLIPIIIFQKKNIKIFR